MEHCLEHLGWSDANRLLAECRRVLVPGGVVRIIVPDAELFINAYTRLKAGEQVTFPEPYDSALSSDFLPIMVVNRIFRDFGHLYAYDFECMAKLLQLTSFHAITRCDYNVGARPELLIDTKARQAESLYVEAIRL
jgi:predicted SAM-dependent methyltransferase